MAPHHLITCHLKDPPTIVHDMKKQTTVKGGTLPFLQASLAVVTICLHEGWFDGYGSDNEGVKRAVEEALSGFRISAD